MSPTLPHVSRFSIAALAVGVLAGLARDASAEEPTKEQCIAANENALTLRQSGKPKAARAELLVCVARGCPGPVRDDCMEQLNDVEKAIPTIVFAAKGAAADLSAVKITMDKVVLTERLDGSPLSVEPGEHTFEFVTEGEPTVIKTFIIYEGAKARHEVIAFASAAAVAGGRLVVIADGASTVSIDGAVQARGRFDGRLSPGAHEVRVTEPGKSPYKASVDLRDGEARTMHVMLEEERHRSALPWIIGGAVVVAAAAGIGGYFLFRPQDKTGPAPTGTLGSGSVTFSRFTAFGR